MATVPPQKKDDTTVDEESTRIVSADALRRLRESPEEHRAVLVVIAGEDLGSEYCLDENPAVIGRSEDASICVASRSVSRQHARVTYQCQEGMERFFIEDLGSRNGTLVNNAPVQVAPLHDGDKVQVGEVVFKFLERGSIDAQFHREIHRLINYNQLTGLMTMESFRRVLEQATASVSAGQTFSLAMTDLDGLKKVNDTYGHLAGRMTIAEMGGVMRGVLRAGDLAGLYGGDEAIVLYPSTSIAQAATLAEALRKRIEERLFDFRGNTFSVTISQGLAEWPRHGRTCEEIIAAADKALYRAKADGRNCVRLCDN